MNKRFLILCAIFLALCVSVTALVLWWTRYQTVEIRGSRGFYRINRFTGETTLFVNKRAIPIKALPRVSAREEATPPEAPSYPAPAPEAAPAPPSDEEMMKWPPVDYDPRVGAPAPRH